MPLQLQLKNYICERCGYTATANEETGPYSLYYVDKWKIQPGHCANCHRQGIKSRMAINLADSGVVTTTITKDELDQQTTIETDEFGAAVMVETGEYQDKLILDNGQPVVIPEAILTEKQRELTTSEKRELSEQIDTELSRIEPLAVKEITSHDDPVVDERIVGV